MPPGPGSGRAAGFPAPAGMDPGRSASPPKCAWIPRTRGDGPLRVARADQLGVDSPHPRGWTAYSECTPYSHEGFPAPAGMDPSATTRCAGRAWIPRTRGDGPAGLTALVDAAEDSPHPRGWTLLRPHGPAPAVGFPAPAGMDLRQSHGPRQHPRIPRTRGDGPRSLRSRMRSRADSPHPRGWTLEDGPRSRPVGGFPAPAGMDPMSKMINIGDEWIPRTRGDGPGSSVSIFLSLKDSPHPRGWTRQAAYRARRKAGFPAPAGMDPAPPA